MQQTVYWRVVMFRRLGLGALFLSSCIGVTSLNANTSQVFYPAAFQNPAAMQHIHDTRMVSGIFFPNINFKFTGTVLGRHGTIKSNNTLFFPYFVGAHRVQERVVLGVDVSNPILGYTTWPVNGFQRALSVTTIVESYEVTPKMSISLNSKLAIGGSFRYLNVYRGQLDYTVLNSLVTNHGTGQGIGGTVGFWWMINPQTFLDFSYFTPIKFALHGTSTSGPFISTNLRTNSLLISPGTYILNLLHVFGPKFSLFGKFAYSCWDTKRLILKNVAIGLQPTVLNLNLHHTFMGSAGFRYQPYSKLAFNALAGYDQAWTGATHNSLTFPFGNLWFGGLGLEIKFTDLAWIKLFAGQGRSSRPKVNNPPAFVNGINKSIYTWGDISGVVNF